MTPTLGEIRSNSLPIDERLAAIVEAAGRVRRVVVHAPPGSGKTTRVPAALLDARSTRGEIVVLEPRRIAARAAADFVAAQRGSSVGDEVGFQVRFERRGGPGTRLWFVTEGILTRRFARDPFLEDVGAVVLDEFHERHLQSDLALALALELQRSVRPDLQIVVMSATLDAERIATHMGGCPIVRVSTRPHPVVVHYQPERTAARLDERVLGAVRSALREGVAGDVLVFLPGVGEIRRLASGLEPIGREYGVAIVGLHGSLPLDEQRRVLRPTDERRIVLATNVAETALTIDGVTCVIDSGLARTARYDAKLGFNTLHLRRISRASAAQRSGRAGRTAPGTCWRLWSPAEDADRPECDLPEVHRLDLADVVLHVRVWGLAEPDALPWLDPPTATALAQARSLLQSLGALDADEGLTEIGRRMAGFGAAPRVARMLLEAAAGGDPGGGALAAALVGERDIRRGHRLGQEARSAANVAEVRFGPEPLAHSGSDLIECAELFVAAAQGRFTPRACAALDLDRSTVLAVERARLGFTRALGAASDAPNGIDPVALGRCILAGFPDRVVRRREVGSPRGVMVGGRGIVLDARSAAAGAELFVALDADLGPRRQRSEAWVRTASAVRREWLAEVVPDNFSEGSEVLFDEERLRVVERWTRRYLDLPLSVEVGPCGDTRRAGEVLASAAIERWQDALAWGRREEEWLARVGFAGRSLPEVGFPAVMELVGAVVRKLCASRHSFAELRQVALLPELKRALPPGLNSLLERELPEVFELPSGRAGAIRYTGEHAPFVEARVQELFGLLHTPTLGRGRLPLVFEVLGPNHRPVQRTRDLESFWRSGYPEVRRQLRGRYPRHAWPEDPFSATATRGNRRKE